MDQIRKLRRLAAKLLPGKHRREVHRRIDATLTYLQAPYLPSKSQSAAVATENAKTAALVYDRVWDGTMGRHVPESIGFRGRSDFEVAMMVASTVGPYLIREVPFDSRLEPLVSLLKEMTVGSAHGGNFGDHDVYPAVTRALAESIGAHYRFHVAPVYANTEKRDLEYRAGDRAVLTAVLTTVAVPDEQSLTWEQVAELRNDAESRRRLIRLNHWLDAEMVGKSWQYVEDEIAVRIDDYEHAIRKHGIRTIIGSLSRTLDSKLLIAGSLSAFAGVSAGQPMWGAIGAAAVVAGKVAVNLASSLLDLQAARRETHPEIAFVVEVKQHASGSTA